MWSARLLNFSAKIDNRIPAIFAAQSRANHLRERYRKPISTLILPGRYRSGQTGRTVNPLAYAFAGSNPALPTFSFEPARTMSILVPPAASPSFRPRCFCASPALSSTGGFASGGLGRARPNRLPGPAPGFRGFLSLGGFSHGFCLFNRTPNRFPSGWDDRSTARCCFSRQSPYDSTYDRANGADYAADGSARDRASGFLRNRRDLNLLG